MNPRLELRTACQQIAGQYAHLLVPQAAVDQALDPAALDAARTRVQRSEPAQLSLLADPHPRKET